MSHISDPSSKQEAAYTAYLERLVFLLSKRIVWNMKQEKFDEDKWATMFKKLYKNIYLRDKTREIGTRFSETIKELADALNVVPSDEWTMDSVTSRWSVLSRPLMLRRPSEDVSARRILVRDKSKENKSCNNSFNESLSNRRNLSKPRRYESKVRAALDRIVDQSIRAFNPGANSIDDQSFYSVLHPTNRFNIPDENQPSRDVSFTTDSELPPVKPIAIKKRPQNNVNNRKRPQTPQMYYRGVFDVTATAKPANSIPSVNNIDKSVQQSRPSTVNDFEAVIAESKSMLKDYVSVIDHDPLPNLHSNYNSSRVETPEAQEENIIDFKKILPQKNKLYGRTGTPLKAYTGSFYNQHPKSRSNSASKRTILDNSILNEDNHKSSVRRERHESGKKVFLLNNYNLDA